MRPTSGDFIGAALLAIILVVLTVLVILVAR